MKKNIAIIVHSLHGGGAERIAGLLAKNLSEYYNVYLFVMDCSDIVYDYSGEIINLSIEGMDYVEYYLEIYKKKYDIDCAISFTETVNFMNIKTKGKESVIISERCSQSPIKPYLYCRSANIKKLYNYADKIVSVAHGVKYDLIKNYGVQEHLIKTIYNFIDKDAIVKKSKETIDNDIMQFVGSSKVILNVGRMVPQKNQIKLIVQFAKLINDGEDVKLLIIGSGELEHELIKISKSLGVERFVKIIKYNKNPFPFYKLATIVALTSEYEGLPNVILEAMLLGVPVVATDCLSGPRELLMMSKDYTKKIKGYLICKNGILVEQAPSDEIGETMHFKEAMKCILHNEQLRNSIICNELEFMSTYSNQKILNEWIDVIENTIPSRKIVPIMMNQEIQQAKKVIVYGAGFIGKQVMQQFLEQNDKPEFICFAVTKKKEVENICGIPVYNIEEIKEYNNDAIVLVGVSDKYSGEVVSVLKKYGFHNIQFPILKGMKPTRKI